MEESKIIETVEYLRIIPQMAYYLKSHKTQNIFKYKSLLFATGGEKGRIYLMSNSLENMGTLCGHKEGIYSLCKIPNKILVSGEYNSNIKIWDLEGKSIISTLFGHTNWVSALCYMGNGIIVSGSGDKSLIIWNIYKYKVPGSSSNMHMHVLTGHTSTISGIIRINNTDIISGEFNGNLRIWNVLQGVCIRHIEYAPNIPNTPNLLSHMKQQYMGNVAVSDYWGKISIWGGSNNWENSLKQFSVCAGISIEFLDRNILLRGGAKGELEFIDYREIGCFLPPSIQGLHSNAIYAIQRIAKNIVITASVDITMKIIDPILRKCYLNFQGDNIKTIVYYH